MISSASQSTSTDLVRWRKTEMASLCRTKEFVFQRRKRCTPCYSNPVPSIAAQPLRSLRSQAYSGPVSRASHPQFAFIVRNQITQTRLGSPNFKEPCVCLSSSPPKEKPRLYLSRKERLLA